MCGISGVYNFTTPSPVGEDVIRRMNHVQAYRGPDGEGIHLEGPVGLGNRRLAIVDRARGHQPMSDEEAGLWITYNGEVFNHRELRAQLEAAGHRFRTDADTEVVLQAYRAWGEGCVDRFNGQFAFAVWDAPASTLFLARDRLGIVPLHYALADGAFVFASEAKAILEHPGVRASIDGEAVVEALLCGTLFDGRTLFRGIRSLPPGHVMTVSPAGTRLRQYWDIPLAGGRDGDAGEAYYAERLLPLLEDALQIRLMGEVPWGLMLSGGTDSSTLAALATRMTAEPVQTFTIDFPNAWKGTELDAHYARLMAERLTTRHHEFMTRPEDYYETLETVVWHLERPFNKGASTMYLLYRQLKEYATVVITGEGADELFAGYVGERGLGLDEVMQSGGIDQFPWAAYWQVTSRLFGGDFERELRPQEIFRDRLAGALPQGNGDVLNRALYLYTKYFLLELLELHDRTSLASGVEARLPFLDHRFVELLCPMPSHFKVRDGRTKHLFKEVIKDLIPPAIVARRKTPMPIPRDPQTLIRQVALARDLVIGSGSRSRDYYDLARVGDFLDRKGEFAGVDALTVWKVSMYLITLELLHRAFRL